MGSPRVGVLALQGAFARHGEVLNRLGAEVIEVRNESQLMACDALVMPGGESTTVSKLLATFDLAEPIAKFVADGTPVLGTCAGMILLAGTVLDGRPDQISFNAVDIEVRRNGYGRQIDSFEADLSVDALGPEPFRAVFIRAPLVESAGPDVDVLARWEDQPVLCRQGNVLVCSFHPELTEDDRLHRYFIDLI